ncbi:MAG TPA: MHYT domain-containing protein [Ramlibacter sp.]|uniref:MHYT domain-containing protein n=1 Tax=Ramlibacter sp. TaxID=1917967 RepID=UPI002ED2D016
MEQVVSSSYQSGFVALSYAISAIGSYVALNSANGIRRPDGRIRLGSTVAAGIALGGIGVWSMHFIGMLALKLDAGSSYAMVETVVSLVAAIVGSALALGFVARAPHRLGRIAGAGLLLGIGVVVMHYLGMFGMKIGGFIRWDYEVVAHSAMIAVAAATAALWLAFNTASIGMRAVASLVMGVAVCAMHYTGMRAAEFVCTVSDRAATPQGFGYVSAAALPYLVVFGAMTMAALITVYQLYQSSTEDYEDMESRLAA